MLSISFLALYSALNFSRFSDSLFINWSKDALSSPFNDWKDIIFISKRILNKKMKISNNQELVQSEPKYHLKPQVGNTSRHLVTVKENTSQLNLNKYMNPHSKAANNTKNQLKNETGRITRGVSPWNGQKL